MIESMPISPHLTRLKTFPYLCFSPHPRFGDLTSGLSPTARQVTFPNYGVSQGKYTFVPSMHQQMKGVPRTGVKTRRDVAFGVAKLDTLLNGQHLQPIHNRLFNNT
jgi:hypothetical protein